MQEKSDGWAGPPLPPLRDHRPHMAGCSVPALSPSPPKLGKGISGCSPSPPGVPAGQPGSRSLAPSPGGSGAGACDNQSTGERFRRPRPAKADPRARIKAPALGLLGFTWPRWGVDSSSPCCRHAPQLPRSTAVPSAPGEQHTPRPSRASHTHHSSLMEPIYMQNLQEKAVINEVPFITIMQM